MTTNMSTKFAKSEFFYASLIYEFWKFPGKWRMSSLDNQTGPEKYKKTHKNNKK